MTDQFGKGGVLLAVITAICSGVGVTLMKLGFVGDPFRLAVFLAGLAIYGAGVVFGILLLGAHPISIAYPIVVGLSLVVVAGISATTLGEAMTPSRLLGTVMIILGVYLLLRSPSTLPKQPTGGL